MNDLISTVRQMMGQTELSQEIFIDAIESALMQAARRRYGTTDGVNIEIDKDLGEIRCFVPKRVVDIMKSYAKEIPIEEARLIKPDAVIDDIIEVEADLKDFGRIEAATARQILAQKIKDAEKEQVLQIPSDDENIFFIFSVLNTVKSHGNSARSAENHFLLRTFLPIT